MRFLIDEQLPPALARRLRRKGHAAEHMREVGLAGEPDLDIRAYARRVGAVIISKDEDFADISARPRISAVWIRLGNVTNKALWGALERALPEIVEALGRGETLIEIA